MTTVETVLLPLPHLDSYTELIKMAWERKKLPVRLLGIGANLSQNEEIQLTLF